MTLEADHRVGLQPQQVAQRRIDRFDLLAMDQHRLVDRRDQRSQQRTVGVRGAARLEFARGRCEAHGGRVFPALRIRQLATPRGRGRSDGIRDLERPAQLTALPHHRRQQDGGQQRQPTADEFEPGHLVVHPLEAAVATSGGAAEPVLLCVHDVSEHIVWCWSGPPRFTIMTVGNALVRPGWKP